MNNHTFATLFGRASTGKLKEWSIEVEDRGASSYIITKHGFTGGKIQVSEKEISEGKNLGKKNETTPHEQAVSEARSSWKKKKDKKYSETIPEETAKDEGIPLPMLAHGFKDRGHNIKWKRGVWIQRKLDGIRLFATKMDEDTIRYTSRSGKVFVNTLDSFTPALLDALEIGDIIDGEIFTRNLTFQQIVSAVKNEAGKEQASLDYRDLLEFHIYDLASSPSDFEVRTCEIVEKVSDYKKLIIVDTYYVESLDEALAYHAQFMEEGYEGTMLRNSEGKYKFRHRSTDLQKMKDFQDEEGTIIGGKEGTGKSKGQCVFLCESDSGKQFYVRCKGTDAEREAQWRNLESHIGQRLTYRFQDKTDDGIPRFPVGISIRDYE